VKFLSAFCVLLVVCAGALRAQEERITDFMSAIEVQVSGDVAVTETIAVVAEGDHIKHGIYRDFPTLYRSSLGLKRSVAFDVISVRRDGRDEVWRSEARGNGVRVSIGSADVMLTPGPHVYTLTYRTNHQLVQRADFDELYWNMTGTQWAFPIERATARVRLPTGARVKEINGYTGAAGAKGKAWRTVSESGWNVVAETTQPLAPGEGFTLSVTWQKGIVDANANPAGVEEIVRDNPRIALGLGGMGVVFVYYVMAWILIGRDPRRGVIIPLYHPPKGFNAPAVRYLAGMGTFDNKSFAAAVLELAVAGAATIRCKVKDKFVLERREKGAEALPLPYRAFFRDLLGMRQSLELDSSQHAVFQKARATLLKTVQAETEKRFFVRNSGWWLGGLVLSLVPAGVALLDSNEGAGALFMLLWLSIWSLGVMGLLITAMSAWKSGKILTALPMTLFALPFIGGWFFGAWQLCRMTSPWIVGVFLIAFVLNAIFHQLLKAPTLEGRRVMDQIEGFRRYLSIGERDRLNLENPPERTPELYEAFLPFALALDVEQKWSEQFVDVLANTEYRPEWYHGGNDTFFAPMAFASTIGGAFASAIASSSSAPGSSSGSGGGGSSGGGGGGGGGGGW
jgi:uncharacterized membrane protein YgcG